MSDGGVTFAIPSAPPIHPVHPVGATVAVITKANRRHREKFWVLCEYKDTDAALKHQLLATVNNDYVAELKHTKLGCANVTTLDLLSHLHDQYSTIEPKIMNANSDNMTQPWACIPPLVKLTTRIEYG